MTSNSRTARLPPWLETAWLQRYLDRQLDADEIAWFEEYLFDKTHLLDRVDADSDLRDTVVRAAARIGAGDAFAPPLAVPARRAAPRPHRVSGRAATALAASLFAAVGVGWFARQVAAPAAPLVIASPMRVVFDPQRGLEAKPLVEQPSSAADYVLVEVAVPPGAEDVRMTAGDQTAALASSADGFVTFLVERSRLKARAATVAYRLEGRQVTRTVSWEGQKGDSNVQHEGIRQ